MSKVSQLENLKKECLNCNKCCIGCVKIKIKDNEYNSNVFSNMCMKARIMVIGQNPGSVEIIKKVPFVGASGKNFDKAVNNILELDRSYFYITNVVHCYTPNDRTPSFEEIENCRYFIDNEIDIIKPNLIITLGGASMKVITGRSGIMKNRGKFIVSPRYGITVLPMLHPSPLNLLRENNRKLFFEDFELVKKYF